jgi:hypothetical protein
MIPKEDVDPGNFRHLWQTCASGNLPSASKDPEILHHPVVRKELADKDIV